ncbi:MAG: MFS transporter [Betaproteobacteria bacterium]
MRTASRQGLLAIFGSTLFQLTGIFMLSPLLLLLLRHADVSNTVAGLFAATSWLGIFIITPFASQLTRRIGRRRALWLASTVPLATAFGFLLTSRLEVWFGLELLASVAGGLRWVLAEAFIAEFTPPDQRGRYIGAYSTLIGLTFVMGPALLAWLGDGSSYALWVVIGFMGTGLAWTALVPRTPPEHDADSAKVGIAGLWHAVAAHPVIMLAGFVGGFFELGLSSILPLYGLNLGLPTGAATLLVSVSGMGGMALALPGGLLIDRLKNPAQGRRTLMLVLVALLLAASFATLGVHNAPWLVWPVAALWGAAGGNLYTLTMTDISSREAGITLVNSTAVLVLAYTLGALVASSLSGALIDASPWVGFPLVLVLVSGLATAALVRARRRRDI